MAKSKAEVRYEGDVDILSFWRGIPSKASIEVGDFVIDVDNKGYISGLEILNVSENLDINAKDLGDIDKASMSVTYKPGYVYILLKCKFKGKEKEVSIPLTIDLGHKRAKREQILFSN